MELRNSYKKLSSSTRPYIKGSFSHYIHYNAPTLPQRIFNIRLECIDYKITLSHVTRTLVE